MLTPFQNRVTARQNIARHLIIMFSLTYSLVWSAPVAAQDCATVVTEVQRLYEVGRTAEMITRLSACLPDGITDQAEKVQAYRYLSLAHIGEDHLPEARDVVEKLLDLNENFEPDPTTDPSRFIEFVTAAKNVRAEVRAQEQAKKSRKRKLLFIGGGTLLAAGVTAAIIFATGSSTPRLPLPDPPPFPEN